MNELNRDMIEEMVRKLLMEKLMPSTQKDPSGIIKIGLPSVEVDDASRLDTGNPNDRVWCKDLFTLEESPRLGCGLMVMEDTTFPWHLSYDEIDYIIEGQLDIIVDGRTTSAGPGEVLLIPKDSDIQFSVKGKARFVYVTYPADWNS